MANELVRNMLVEQRKRMVGSLMAHLEKEIFPHVDARTQKELRGKVLATVGAYHDVCLDLLKAAVPDGTVVNQDALQRISSQITRLSSEVRELKGA